MSCDQVAALIVNRHTLRCGGWLPPLRAAQHKRDARERRVRDGWRLIFALLSLRAASL